ncbi:MAG: hypothetical protein ACFFCQ_13135 [Promethearchaeota archaeon]
MEEQTYRFYDQKWFIGLFHWFFGWTASQCASIADCGNTAIYNRISKYNANRKNRITSAEEYTLRSLLNRLYQKHQPSLLPPPSITDLSSYRLWENDTFLKVFYVFLGMSPRQCAKIAQCGKTTMDEAIKLAEKRGILPKRDLSTASRLVKQKKARSILIIPEWAQHLRGSLLSDGCIATSYKDSYYVAYYTIFQESKRKAYLTDYVRPITANSGYDVDPKYRVKRRKDVVTTKGYELRSPGTVELLEWERSWYRETTAEEKLKQPWKKRVKILPLEFSHEWLTKITVRAWYVEDGSLKSKDYKDTITYWVHLSTHNFTEPENHRLSSSLKERLGLPNNSDLIAVKKERDYPKKFGGKRDRSKGKTEIYSYIRIRGHSVGLFFDHIGWDPVPSFEDKFPPRAARKKYFP